MAVPTVRSEFKEFCLRRLGKPVIDINVSDDQVDDRVDEALKKYWDYHYDGSAKVYYKHQIDANTIANRYITLPDNIISVTGIFDLGSFTTSTSYLFDINYHVAIDTLYQLSQGGNLGNYYVTRMNYSQIQEILVGKPLVRFERHHNKLMLDISADKLKVGYWIIVEGYQRIDPSDAVVRVSTTTETGNNVLVTSNTFIDGTVGAYVTGTGIPANTYVDSVTSNTNLVITNSATANGTVTVTFEPPSDVWSDLWLQRYTTALVKYQWGSNLTKFDGLQLPGGITFNGVKIIDDADAELKLMHDELINTYSLPVSDMVG